MISVHFAIMAVLKYSREVSTAVLRKKQVTRGPLAWDDEKAWFILHSKCKDLRNSVLKEERNRRLFQQRALDPFSLVLLIINAIRDCKLSWRNVRPSQETRDIFSMWNVDIPYLLIVMHEVFFLVRR